MIHNASALLPFTRMFFMTFSMSMTLFWLRMRVILWGERLPSSNVILEITVLSMFPFIRMILFQSAVFVRRWGRLSSIVKREAILHEWMKGNPYHLWYVYSMLMGTPVEAKGIPLSLAALSMCVDGKQKVILEFFSLLTRKNQHQSETNFFKAWCTTARFS